MHFPIVLAVALIPSSVPYLSVRSPALVETYRAVGAQKGAVRLTIFSSGAWESTETVDREVTGRTQGKLPEEALERARALVAEFRREVASNGWVEPDFESDPSGMSAVRAGPFQSHDRRSPSEPLPAPYAALFQGLGVLIAK